jgi:hypothetical protein
LRFDERAEAANDVARFDERQTVDEFRRRKTVERFVFLDGVVGGKNGETITGGSQEPAPSRRTAP